MLEMGKMYLQCEIFCGIDSVDPVPLSCLLFWFSLSGKCSQQKALAQHQPATQSIRDKLVNTVEHLAAKDPYIASGVGGSQNRTKRLQ